ncbi:MAG: hypothetical protein RSB05_03115 [Clostridiales bacterium]
MTNLVEKAAPFREVIFPVIFFIAVLIFVIIGVNNMAATAGDEQLKNIEDSLRRNATQCYAIEGQYPENLQYLADNYNVILDKEDYVYHYAFLGSNVMPQIFVFSR